MTKQPNILPGLGRRIAQARRARELTQTQLAQAIGTYFPQVSTWERDERAPHPKYLVAIARVLNVSLDWLCGLSLRGGAGDVVRHRPPQSP
jgi:transcriptional regulator with XRE-family HTH domain